MPHAQGTALQWPWEELRGREQVIRYLISQFRSSCWGLDIIFPGCRNLGNFALELASWAFHPLECWEAVLSNMPGKYLPNQEQGTELAEPDWVSVAIALC